MTDPDSTDYERGERQALLELRSFITKHGLREVDAYCAQRLADIRLDAAYRKPVRDAQWDESLDRLQAAFDRVADSTGMSDQRFLGHMLELRKAVEEVLTFRPRKPSNKAPG